MADVIEYRIYGEELQLVEVILDPGEGVQAEAGTMTYRKMASKCKPPLEVAFSRGLSASSQAKVSL